MKIVRLEVENVKRVRSVLIEDGAVAGAEETVA